MTGTVVPGMLSSTARSSGAGNSSKPAMLTGMVDQRFDHMDSGKLSPDDDRAYLVVPSVTWTHLPYMPPMAQSRTESASPVNRGTRDRPWVRCPTVTP